MDATNKDLSLMFYQYLCDVIGSEEVVRSRRGILASYGKNITQDKTYFVSGSKAEGLNFKDSDFDLMLILSLMPVYENNYSFSYLHEKQQLIMDSLDTKPGFTKIKPYFKVKNQTWFKNVNEQWYMSSKLFREYFNMFNTAGIIHGPCSSTSDNSIDIAHCLHCSKWISLVQPWIVRSQYSWATAEVLKQIIDFGVLFVPIGYKNSPQEDIEWRISFYHAEKLLIWSLNHVQFLCYALMKIVLKDLIKKRHGDLLCSYFMKTIIFWMCEETEVIQWRPDKILLCFTSCLKRLLYCVQHKTCLHYFIPENNFFEERFDVDQHKSLLVTITELFSFGWVCLVNTETLRIFRNLNARSLTSDVLSVSFISFCYEIVPTIAPFRSRELKYDILKTNPIIIYNIYHLLQRKELKDFLIYTLSFYCQVLAGKFLSNVFVEGNNKKKYNFYRKGLCYSLLGTNHDAISGWVLLALFFYMNKENLKCERLLEYILSKRSEDTLLVTRNMDARDEHLFSMIQRTLRLRMIHMCKMFTVLPVLLQEHSNLLPNELNFYYDTKEIIILPPFDFAWYLASALRMRYLNFEDV